MASPVEQPASYGRGAIIGGKYRLDQKVGEGGMATVWRATHLSLRRPVAVKFLHLEGTDRQEVQDRFLREARLAAAVRHRNLTDILDFGTTREGRPYMVMELLEGESLADRLIDGRTLSVVETVRVVERTLAGLAAVHDAGIVHRDLKPENIFLVEDANELEPKLFDFGISRSLGATPGLRSALPTRDSVIVGTPQYMSPEQARGLRDLDHRTDIYSIGAVLYELLSGRLPFESAHVGDLLVMITTQDPRPLLSYRPDLPELVAVVERALARDREARFQTALKMREALLQAADRTSLSYARPYERSREDEATRMPAAVAEPAAQGAEADSGGPSPAAPSPVAPSAAAPSAAGASAAAPSAVEPSVGGAESEPAAWQTPITESPPAWPLRRAALASAGIVAAAAVAAVVVVWSAAGDDPVSDEAMRPAAASPQPAPSNEGERAHPGAAPEDPSAAARPDDDSAPATPVVVHLRGMPEDARVLVNGAAHESEPIELPRDGKPHEIVVTARGARWSVTHVANEDGEYPVELGTRAARRRTRPSSTRPARTTPPRGREELYREPGF